MEESRGSVRMGPVSLFVLIITLCLAVLTVLSITTAYAEKATTNQQSLATVDNYRNEESAQEFLAELDAVLAKAGSRSDALASAGKFIADYNDKNGNQGFGVSAQAEISGSEVQAVFAQASGRQLTIQVRINDDLSYTVLAWQATTKWVEPGSDNMLWQG